MYVCVCVCVYVCVSNGLDNGWMDVDDSFLFYLLTMDPRKVIVNFDFWKDASLIRK